MLKCPFSIMMPEHYRNDGTCKCDDPDHREMMIHDWDYSRDDFKDIPLRIYIPAAALTVLNQAVHEITMCEYEDTLVGHKLSEAIDNLGLVWAQIYNEGNV